MRLRARPSRRNFRPASLVGMPMRTKLLLSLLAVLALAPASPAAAKSSIRVGVADQSPAMFASPAFQAAEHQAHALLRARRRHARRGRAREGDGVRDRRARRRRLDAACTSPRPTCAPSAARSSRRRATAATSASSSRTSASSASRTSAPGTRSTTRRRRRGTASATPSRTSRACTRAVKRALPVVRRRRPRRARPGRRRTATCARFYARLSSTWRKRLTVVGIHNYSDVNRNRSTRHGEDHRHRAPLQQAHEVLVHRDRRAGELRRLVPATPSRARPRG